MNERILQVTQNILERSQHTRKTYLQRIDKQLAQGKARAKLHCGNLAHTIATCCSQEKQQILDFTTINVGIISAYNDMVSAHYPYLDYPQQIKDALRQLGHSAQVAAGVPAMCDGITQGQEGMDLSLFSRDLIAQATAIGLSHNTFDATLLLGICDKIAPGQLIGALSFGHLPTIFVPAGPMESGISNKEKVYIRQQYAAGLIGKDKLQEMENNSYHGAGTCTFYGTANTNQLVFEAMGLMLPGSAFVPVNTQLRAKLTELTTKQLIKISQKGQNFRPLAHVVNEKSLVNGLVALLASGGSTNHTIHLIAVARAAGFILTWDDFSQLSEVVPLLA
ncbi:dihydroxy-acid dehydratase, partial [Haemophilus haemoglobinophilus]|nr:dihydroxy-acid dehydratase [Canicola haemoglobinophilus]